MRRFSDSWNSTLARLRLRRTFGRSAGPFRSLYRRRLGIEGLEERRLLATFTVSNDDDGLVAGTLRKAIADANASPGEDIIEFNISGGPATILLEDGELEITDDLTIDGPGAANLTIDADQSSRIFHVPTSFDVSVSIKKLTLINGDVVGDINGYGGAILFLGADLTIDDVTFRANNADLGGAVYHGERSGATGHTLLVRNSRFFENSATYEGGAIRAQPAFGDVTITNSHFEGNWKSNHAGGTGGGALWIDQQEPARHVRISYSDFVSNHADSEFSQGGAIYLALVGESSVGIINNVQVYDNEAEFGGGIAIDAKFGSVTISNSDIGDTNPELGNVSRSHGGGIFATGGFSPLDGGAQAIRSVSLVHSTVLNNSAGGDGGGISVRNSITGPAYQPGELRIQDSVISGNISESSGGGFAYQGVSGHPSGEPANGTTVSIERSLIANNTANRSGGGLFISMSWQPPVKQYSFDTVLLRDSTISGNTAYGAHGYFASGGGGGIYLSTPSSYRNLIVNSTISGNRGLNGGGIFLQNSYGTEVRHSTIAKNIAGPFDPGDGVPGPATEPQLTAGGGIFIRPANPGNSEDTQLVLDHTIIGDNEHHPDEPDPDPNPPNDVNNSTPAIGTIPWYYFGPPSFAEHLDNLGWEPFEIETNYSIIEDLASDHYVNLFVLTGNNGNQFDDAGLAPQLDANGDWSTLPAGYALLTHALLQGSDAINAGNSSLAAGNEPTPKFDQRGYPYDRIVGVIDIGAFELQEEQPQPPVCPPGDYNDDGTVNAADYVVWRDIMLAGDPYVFMPNDVTPGYVDQTDYDVWRANFGATCESQTPAEVAILPGDYNHDGVVDNADRDVWEADFGSETVLDADGNGNGIVDLADLAIWQEMRGATTLDVIPGDFNGDGVVDMSDYNLWEDDDPLADADHDSDVDNDDLDIWEAHFGWTNAGFLPIILNANDGPPLKIAGHAPRVTNVTVGGTNSTHADYDFDGVAGSGEQLRTIPVGGVDTVSITFNEQVRLTLGALKLTRLDDLSNPTVSDFFYDVSTETATWEFTSPLARGQYLIELSDLVYDLDRDSLDGEFTNPWSLAEGSGYASTFPSGDGEEGGDFRFRFTNLPGDFSRNNVVDSGDGVIWTANNGTLTGALQSQGDADGDGDVDSTDNSIRTASFGVDYTRWPSVEPGMILVSTLVDEADSDYTYGDLSLREAIVLAYTLSGRETIVFDPSLFGGTIALAAAELYIATDVDIIGPGVNLLTIDAGEDSRVIQLGVGDVTISGLTITGGLVSGLADGAGVYVGAGNLTLENVTVVGNAAGDYGGGIYVSQYGSLRLVNSTVDSNTSGTGGGIFAHVGDGDRLYIAGSTISNNASSMAGGVFFYGLHSTSVGTIINSTLSGNSASSSGGVRASNTGELTIVNSTITDNHATAGQGGGIVRTGWSYVTLHNTIVADNTASAGYHDLASWNDGSFTSGSSHNLIGDAGNSGLSTSTNLVIGASGDPGLMPLDYYGGLTKTHALFQASPAIDAGFNEKAMNKGSALSTDQRGFRRDVDIDGDGPLGETIDIGAFEFGAALIVSTLVDEADSDYTYGDLSLREAIVLASTLSGRDTIVFDESLFGGTIALVGYELYIASDVDIVGPGAELLTIDAGGYTRVIQIGFSDVSIKGLTITGGVVTGLADGAGIYATGDITLEDVAVVGNTAGDFGGGIYVSMYGSLRLVNSTVDSNSSGTGGGIFAHIGEGEKLYIANSTISNNTSSYGGGLLLFGVYSTSVGKIVNSTVSGNSASSSGGLNVANAGELTIVNSTITDNHATAGQGGGIVRTGWSYVTLHNTIVADNTASAGYHDLASWNDGSFTSGSSHNLIGDAGNSGLSTSTNLVIGTSGDPGLMPLDYYGGSTKTHKLLIDSPAIDAGDDDIAGTFDLFTDQRHLNRVDDGDWDGFAHVDIGAFELAADEYFAEL